MKDVKYTQEYFQSLLKNLNIPFYDDKKLEEGVKKISISNELKTSLLNYIQTKEKEEKLKRVDITEHDVYLNLINIEKNSMFWKMIEEEFPHHEFIEIRLHSYSKDDRCKEHRDGIHPGYDSLILRLDENENPRLTINKKEVEENGGNGYILPEHTLHSVNIGNSNRYSLVAWLKNKFGE